MKNFLLLILFTAFKLFACLPIDVERNLISHQGYISFQVSGLNQHSLNEVTSFINKVATKANRNSLDVIDLLKDMDIPSGVITKEGLESAIIRSLSTYDPSRIVKIKSLKGYRKLARQYGELVSHLSPRFVEAYLKKEVKNGAKYIKLFANADPMLARVMSDFVLSNKGLVSDKVFLGIIDEAIKRNISPHDFITLITPARLKEINHSPLKGSGLSH